MKEEYAQEWPQFFTATIQSWKHLLKDDAYKNIIVETLKFLTKENKVVINGFVLMSNHIHLIWQARGSNTMQKIQTSFMKHTSKEFKKQLKIDESLKNYEVNATNRNYNFWKRDSLSIDLFTPDVFYQKLNYIHYNPVKAGLCSFPEEYPYSSALFYEKGIDNFGYLTHYMV
jgi:putative transposase